jgi:hypothetical protein
MLFATALIASTAVSCLPLDMDSFQKKVAQRDQTKVIFFASWCSSCKDHLLSKHPEGTILVATFDERTAAETVINKLNISIPCFSDDGIASHYKIDSLPAEITVSRKGKVIQRL